MTDARLVLSTFPSAEVAASIARSLIEARAAACVNILPGARSIYEWNGEVCDDAEVVALIKTTSAKLDVLRERLVDLHPYECPELIVLHIDAGHAPYLQWLASAVR